MSITYPFYVTNAGAPIAGLTPTWNTLKKVSNGANVSQPAISELGGGWYKFTITPLYGERYIGTIDAGVGQPATERYYNVEFSEETHGKRNYYLHATPIYNEDGDALTFVCFLLEDGEIKLTGITNVTVTVYDETNVLQFTETTTTVTNGIAILVKNAPGLTAGESYYVKIEVVTTQGTLTGMSVYNVYQ